MGFSRKNWDFLDILPKRGGGLTQSKRILAEKTEIFSDFFAKRGGGLAQSKISLTEKIWESKLIGGGSRSFGETPKKTDFFYASPQSWWYTYADPLTVQGPADKPSQDECHYSDWSSCSYYCQDPPVEKKFQALVDASPKESRALCPLSKEEPCGNIACTGNNANAITN